MKITLISLSLIAIRLNVFTQGNFTIGYGTSLLATPDYTFDYYSYRNVKSGGTELNMPNLMHGIALGGMFKIDAPVWFELHYVRRFAQSNISEYVFEGQRYEQQWRRRFNTWSLGVAFGEAVRFGVSVDASRLKFKLNEHLKGQKDEGFKKAYYLNHFVLGASAYVAFRVAEYIEIRPYFTFAPVTAFLSEREDLFYNHAASNFGITLSACLGDSPY